MPSPFAEPRRSRAHGELVGQLARFGAVGMGATAIHVAVAGAYLLLSPPPASATCANLSGFAAAFAVSFAGNALYVFRYRGKVGPVFGRFLAVSLLTLAFSTAVSLVADRLGLSPLIALAAVVAGVPLISFLGHKFWVFRLRSAAGSPAA